MAELYKSWLRKVKTLQQTCTRPVQTRSKPQTILASPQNLTQFEPLVTNVIELIEPNGRTVQNTA